MSRSAQIQAKVDEAIAANEAGDTTTAIAKLESALMLMDGMPDWETSGAVMTWQRAELEKMISRLSLKGHAIQATNVRYDPIA